MTSADKRPINRALVSVYDKHGLDELARGLHEAGVEIVSTGSTADRIAGAGVPVGRVEDLTGFPECLDGRVKTLHPKVHAGILADRTSQSHRIQLDELGIEPFDLIVCNLYPFTDAVADGSDVDDCIEMIDIGGPAMVRAAAKNHRSVAVVVSPAEYPDLLKEVRDGGFTLAQRQRLAADAFAHTASYDVAVAVWMGKVLAPADDGSEFPRWTGASWELASVLRYGENPHQPAALYRDWRGGLADAEQLHGKEMSYNNYVDADAARRTVECFDEPAVAIIKHTNPCGVATGVDVAAAHRKAHACDPVSAFGGVIAVNRPVSLEMAKQVAEVYTEVVVAPGYAEGAVEALSRRKNVRLLRCPAESQLDRVESRAVSGGLLMQVVDRVDAPGDDPQTWTLVSGEPLGREARADLQFAWRVCRWVKSNGIVVASGGATVGIGMGQVNRVDSARLAVSRAGDRASGAVAASDAYFPFADGLQELIAAGVQAVAQPGGSTRDDEVIDAAKSAGLTMYLTHTRHFWH